MSNWQRDRVRHKEREARRLLRRHTEHYAKCIATAQVAASRRGLDPRLCPRVAMWRLLAAVQTAHDVQTSQKKGYILPVPAGTLGPFPSIGSRLEGERGYRHRLLPTYYISIPREMPYQITDSFGYGPEQCMRLARNIDYTNVGSDRYEYYTGKSDKHPVCQVVCRDSNYTDMYEEWTHPTPYRLLDGGLTGAAAYAAWTQPVFRLPEPPGKEWWRYKTYKDDECPYEYRYSEDEDHP